MVPGKSNNSDNYIKQEDDDARIAFAASLYDGYKKTVQCHGCGKGGHFLKECNKTSAKNKEDIFAMVKSGDFKTTKKGVMNTAMEEEPEEPAEVPLKVVSLPSKILWLSAGKTT